MAMVDLKRVGEEDKEEGTMLSPSKPKEPEYPYGLCLMLDEETMTKLGITELPEVGKKLTFTAVAAVRSVSASSYEEDGAVEKHKSCELQVQAMDMGQDAPKSNESRLYG
jgi:hypothetical protein